MEAFGKLTVIAQKIAYFLLAQFPDRFSIAIVPKEFDDVLAEDISISIGAGKGHQLVERSRQVKTGKLSNTRVFKTFYNPGLESRHILFGEKRRCHYLRARWV